MKKTKLLMPLMAIVMMAMSPVKMWAISGSGTSSSPYEIASTSDWTSTTLQTKLTNSSKSSPVYIKITSDFTVSNVMLRDKAPYINLDGQGHTITLSNVSTTEENTGLFGQIGGGEVSNLRIAGNMGSTKKYMGNLCGRVKGDLDIIRVICSASISGDMDGDATAGGIVGQIDGGTVTISKCGFTYRLYGHSKADKMCGMVGYRSGGTVNFYYCFCKAEWVNPKSGDNYAYMRNDGSNTTYGNCYYVSYGTGGKATDKSSGGPTQIDASKFGTGELAYLLNGKENGKDNWWYQNLGETKDPYPFPYNTEASPHGHVYYGYAHGDANPSYNNSWLTRNWIHQHFDYCDDVTWSNTSDPAKCSVTLNYRCKCTLKESETLTPTCTTTNPTCTEDGYYIYTATSTTQKDPSTNSYYSATKEVVCADLLQHGCEGYTSIYEWSGTADAPVCKFTLTCKKCSTTLVTAKTISTEQSGKVDPTCTKKGSISYKAQGTYPNGVYSKSFDEYTSHTYDVAALGHDYSSCSWKWADDGSNATCTFTCSHDESHKLALNKSSKPAVKITSSVTKEATTTTEGEHTYKASVTYDGTTYDAPDKVIADIPKHVHQFATTDLTRDVCTGCGHGFLRFTTENNKVVTPYVAANLQDADGNALQIISNAYDATEGMNVMEFNKALVNLGPNAFFDRSAITSVTIPNTVTSIGGYAFTVCSNLRSVTIPNSVTSIGMRAFSSMYLTSITVDSGNKVYDSRGNCNAIIKKSNNELVFGCRNTTIPNTVTSIGVYAFYGCSSLTSITIPNSVTSIGEFAFENCSDLSSVNIPNSVTSIGRYAFYNCSSLIDITIASPTMLEWTKYLFTSQSKATLRVPSSLVADYKNADNWKDFSKIYCITHAEVEGGHCTVCGEKFGDLNGDGNITIVDLTLLIQILGSNGTITNSAADVDGNGSINLDDAKTLRNMILEAE